MIIPATKRIICKGTLISQTGINSNIVITVFTAAANTKGAIIRRAGGYVSQNLYINAYADTAAPASVWDATKKLVYSFGSSSAARDWNFDYELEIPPGIGFFFYCQGSGGGHNLFCLYELMS